MEFMQSVQYLRKTRDESIGDHTDADNKHSILATFMVMIFSRPSLV